MINQEGEFFQRREKPKEFFVRSLRNENLLQYKKWFIRQSREDRQSNFPDWVKLTQDELKIIQDYCSKREWSVKSLIQDIGSGWPIGSFSAISIEGLKLKETKLRPLRQLQKVDVGGKIRNKIIQWVFHFPVKVSFKKDVEDYFWVHQISSEREGFFSYFSDEPKEFSEEEFVDTGGTRLVDFYKCDDLLGLIKFLDCIQK